MSNYCLLSTYLFICKRRFNNNETYAVELKN
jgi:hypothetical protein